MDPVNIHFTERNIGDLLNEHHVTWGWFSGGFKATSRLPDGTAVCNETHTSKFGVTDTVYDSGNEAFQYYQSTANPHHLTPTSVAAIGHQDRANHQYDLDDFWAAARPTTSRRSRSSKRAAISRAAATTPIRSTSRSSSSASSTHSSGCPPGAALPWS